MKSKMLKLIIGVGLISASMLVPSFADAPQKATISVTGIGQVATKPDMAILNLSVLREAKTARAALTDNNQAMQKILDEMKANGIEDKDLQTSQFSIQPQYVYPKQSSSGERQPPRIIGYQVSNSLTVRIRNLSSLGQILDKSVELGVNQGGHIQFANSDPEEFQMQARTLAVQNAIAKAKTLTSAANIDIGKILNINEQSHNTGPIPMARAEVAMMKADAAAVPIASGENNYRITVNLTFELEQ